MARNNMLLMVFAVIFIAVVAGAVYFLLFHEGNGTDPIDLEPFSSGAGDKGDGKNTTALEEGDNQHPEGPGKEGDNGSKEREEIAPNLENVQQNAQAVGRILDEENNPLAGVEVILHREYYASRVRVDEIPFKEKEDRRTYTDGGGRFFFSNVTAPGRYDLLAAKEGYAPNSCPEVTVKQGEVHTLPDLIMGKGWRISGSVRNAAGQPLAGALVFLDHSSRYRNQMEWDTEVGAGERKEKSLESEAPLPWKKKTVTDDAGHFDLGTVGSGCYEIGAWAEGYALMIKDQVTAEESNREKDLLAEFTLEPSMTISGNVKDVNGAPIPGVDIRAVKDRSREVLSRARTRSAKVDGGFLLGNLCSGPYMISARKKGFCPTFLSRINAGRTSVDIVMKKTASVTGRVLAKDTGKPLERFSVAVCTVEEAEDKVGTLIRGWIPVESKDGTFKIDGLQRGRNRIAARAEGYGNGYSEAVAFEDGREEGPVQITLGKGFGLKGKVENLKGQPVADARVVLVKYGTRSESGIMNIFRMGADAPAMEIESLFQGAVSDGKGLFHIQNVTPGVYSLRVRHPEYEELILPEVNVESKASNYAGTAVLRRGGMLVGKVYAATGELLPDEVVSVNGVENKAFHYARTNAKGEFQVIKIEPGQYELTLADTSIPFGPEGFKVQSPGTTSVIVTEGEKTVVELYKK